MERNYAHDIRYFHGNAWHDVRKQNPPHAHVYKNGLWQPWQQDEHTNVAGPDAWWHTGSRVTFYDTGQGLPALYEPTRMVNNLYTIPESSFSRFSFVDQVSHKEMPLGHCCINRGQRMWYPYCGIMFFMYPEEVWGHNVVLKYLKWYTAKYFDDSFSNESNNCYIFSKQTLGSKWILGTQFDKDIIGMTGEYAYEQVTESMYYLRNMYGIAVTRTTLTADSMGTIIEYGESDITSQLTMPSPMPATVSPEPLVMFSRKVWAEGMTTPYATNLMGMCLVNVRVEVDGVYYAGYKGNYDEDYITTP